LSAPPQLALLEVRSRRGLSSWARRRDAVQPHFTSSGSGPALGVRRHPL